MPTERQLDIILESEVEFNSPSTYLTMTQSNEPTTDVMNEAIALFMGYKKREKLYPTDRQILEGEDLPNWYEDSLKYHASWDWLMPAVLKAKRIYHDSDCGYIRDQLSARYKAIENELRNLSLINTHFCLYRFIIWYNDNQQKQTNG